mgnify:CR=1 FL=1
MIASGTGKLVRKMRRLATKSGVAIVLSGKGRIHCVSGSGNETSKATRATIAGLKTFCPIPPNTCFPITMAMNPPNTATHQGAQGGKVMANSQPVKAAEPSNSVCRMRVQPANFKESASKPRQAAIVNPHKKKEGQP